MRKRVLVISPIFLLLAAYAACASISISASYYNNEEALSSQASIDKAMYDQYMQLEPGDFTWGSSAESTSDEENIIDISATYNDGQRIHSMASSIDTLSGTAKVGTYLVKPYDEDGRNTDVLKQGASFDVKNGESTAEFRSGEKEVSIVTFADGSDYAGTASIGSDSIKYVIRGASNGDANSILAQWSRSGKGDRWEDIGLVQEGDDLNFIWQNRGEISESVNYMDTQVYAWSDEEGGVSYPDMQGYHSSSPSTFLLPSTEMTIIENKYTALPDGSGSPAEVTYDIFDSSLLDETGELKDEVLEGSITNPSSNGGGANVDRPEIIIPSGSQANIWDKIYEPKEYKVDIIGVFDYRMGMVFIDSWA